MRSGNGGQGFLRVNIDKTKTLEGHGANVVQSGKLQVASGHMVCVVKAAGRNSFSALSVGSGYIKDVVVVESVAQKVAKNFKCEKCLNVVLPVSRCQIARQRMPLLALGIC